MNRSEHIEAFAIGVVAVINVITVTFAAVVAIAVAGGILAGSIRALCWLIAKLGGISL